MGLLTVVPAWGEPSESEKSRARAQALKGDRDFDEGRFAAALGEYRAAGALIGAPTLSVREARALERLGRWVEALDVYARVARTPVTDQSPEPFRRAVDSARAEGDVLKVRVPRVTLNYEGLPSGEQPKLWIDGLPREAVALETARMLDVGRHHLRAQAASGQSSTREVTLAASERRTVTLVFTPPQTKRAGSPPLATPAPAAPPAAQPSKGSSVWPLTLLSLGAAGIGLGVTTGALASQEHNLVSDQCPNRVCVPGTEGQQHLDRFRTMRTWSTIGYAFGAVGLAGGITLYLLPSSRPTRVGIEVGPGSLRVLGRFE